MLDDTNASALITQTHLHEAFRNYSGTILNLRVSTETQELFVEEYFLNTEGFSNTEMDKLPYRIFPKPEISHNLS